MAAAPAARIRRAGPCPDCPPGRCVSEVGRSGEQGKGRQAPTEESRGLTRPLHPGMGLALGVDQPRDREDI